MEFNPNKSIYLQIFDDFCDKILRGVFKEEERIPSVREYGGDVGVNPNTVMRSYERLTAAGIIYNKRGIGYFVKEGAVGRVLEEQRREFLANELPELKRRMKLLGIGPEVFSE